MERMEGGGEEGFFFLFSTDDFTSLVIGDTTQLLVLICYSLKYVHSNMEWLRAKNGSCFQHTKSITWRVFVELFALSRILS